MSEGQVGAAGGHTAIDVESGALLAAVIGAIIGLAVGAFAFRGQPVSVGGDVQSIGALAAGLAGLLGIPTIGINYLHSAEPVPRWRPAASGGCLTCSV
jgi:hypothetical protein